MRVAITGVGVVSALGAGVAAHRTALRDGRGGLAPADTLDQPLGVTRPLGRVPAAAWGSGGPPAGDRGRVLLELALREAMARSGHDFAVPGRMVAGTTLAGMVTGTALYRGWREGIAPRRKALREYMPADQAATAAHHCALPGATLLVSDACASGANAIGLAACAVAAGTVPWAVAGGYDPLCAFVVAGFDSLMALAHERCRPFDVDRSGLALGEGAAMLVLEPAEAAAARGAPRYGWVRGYGATSDAHHLTRPAPSGDGAARAIRTALAGAGVAPGELAWVKAHGTATPPNDRMEAVAIRTALGDAAARVPCSSLKGTIGHTLGGAGAVETALALCAAAEGVIPPSHGLEQPDPDCAGLDLVQGRARPHPGGPMLCNAFGFGGSNAALVVEAGEDCA